MWRHSSIPHRGNERLPAFISVEQIHKLKLKPTDNDSAQAHIWLQRNFPHIKRLSGPVHSPAERILVPISSSAACCRFSPLGEILYLCKRSRAGCPAAVLCVSKQSEWVKNQPVPGRSEGVSGCRGERSGLLRCRPCACCLRNALLLGVLATAGIWLFSLSPCQHPSSFSPTQKHSLSLYLYSHPFLLFCQEPPPFAGSWKLSHLLCINSLNFFRLVFYIPGCHGRRLVGTLGRNSRLYPCLCICFSVFAVCLSVTWGHKHPPSNLNSR